MRFSPFLRVDGSIGAMLGFAKLYPAYPRGWLLGWGVGLNRPQERCPKRSMLPLRPVNSDWTDEETALMRHALAQRAGGVRGQ